MKLDWKIWLLILLILGSLLAIFPLDFTKGVKITTLSKNSTAYEQGLRVGEVITAIDGEAVSSFDDFSRIINNKFPTGEKIKLTVTTKTQEVVLFTDQAPEMSVQEIEKTRLKTGLDLSGGARALVAAEKELTAAELNDLIAVTSERLNVYGLKDIQIRPVTDLSGRNYMLIEIAGSSPKELENLIAKQGKLEAKIGNDTV
jgi:membrane-associated protease RseP (regulator of RpoE activity)